MKYELLLIPDVHGRGFWKEAVPLIEAGTPAVFLGDYSDPYRVEGISDREAVENMKEIVGLARRYRDQVTLLLGNHDLSYFGQTLGLWDVGANRYSKRWADEWSGIFWDNADLFALSKMWEVDGRRFLMSHAGIHPRWVDDVFLFDHRDKDDLSAIAGEMEELFHQSLDSTERTALMDALAVTGYRRGGMCEAGSPVWADCNEFEGVEYAGFTQIFGHTQQVDYDENGGLMVGPGKAWVVGKNYCIDCRRCFFLDESGEVRYFDTQEII